MAIVRWSKKFFWIVFFLLAACVTVNVYFPAPAVDEAAQKIVREVWSGMVDPAKAPEKPALDDRSSLQPSGWVVTAGNAVLSWMVTPAEAAADINVSTAAIRGILDRLRNRANGQLRSYLFSGQVGVNRDGNLEIRSEDGLGVPQKAELRGLVGDDNSDRAALYREIAAANGHPEWEGEIRDRFAKKWVSEAPSGWQVQQPDGSWGRK